MRLLVPSLRPGQVVVLDNLAVHRSAPARAAVEAAGCRFVFLPAYSPDLNPIEKAFATCKQALCRLGPRSFEAVVAAVGEALSSVAAADARAFFRAAGYAACFTGTALGVGARGPGGSWFGRRRNRPMPAWWRCRRRPGGLGPTDRPRPPRSRRHRQEGRTGRLRPGRWAALLRSRRRAEQHRAALRLPDRRRACRPRGRQQCPHRWPPRLPGRTRHARASRRGGAAARGRAGRGQTHEACGRECHRLVPGEHWPRVALGRPAEALPLRARPLGHSRPRCSFQAPAGTKPSVYTREG